MSTGLEHARALDAADPLAPLRARFALPTNVRGEPLIYLAGHSLGLAPLAARALLEETFADWSRLGVLAHEQAARPWIPYAEALRTDLAVLAGAAPLEIVAMNSLTVNLHLLLAAFFLPTRTRHRLLIEAGAFPSDRHVVTSQLAWHGLDPADSLIEVAPRAGEDILREGDVLEAIARAGDSLALVLWPGVQYRSGQAFALRPIVAAAHAVGALAGFDLAHAIGNLPLALHDDGADFAAWCSYKYLNAGPGALAGAFIHERHALDPARRHLEGWWGHAPETRFQMPTAFAPADGAARWALSNPPILSSAPLIASLQCFREAGIARLRTKSLALTGFLAGELTHRCAGDVAIVTPLAEASRGAQLSLRIAGGTARARRVYERLSAHDVVADWREPDLIRVAPVPLYNRYADAWQFVDRLAQAIAYEGRGP